MASPGLDAPLRSGMDLLAHVGRRVRELREAHNLSQVEVAQAAGVSARQLARLEAGTANLTLTTLEAIAGALGSRAAALLPHPPAPSSQRKEMVELLEIADRMSAGDVTA